MAMEVSIDPSRNTEEGDGDPSKPARTDPEPGRRLPAGAVPDTGMVNVYEAVVLAWAVPPETKIGDGTPGRGRGPAAGQGLGQQHGLRQEGLA